MKTLICNCRFNFLAQVQVQGDSGGLGLGYVDINSVSLGGYPETELSQHNPVLKQMGHPVLMGCLNLTQTREEGSKSTKKIADVI